MDIHEIHTASGVGVRTLRKLEKMGVLRVTKASGHAELSKIQAALRRGNPLTAYQLMTLYRTPGMISDVGDAKAQMRAETLVEALGDIKREACPFVISANIPGAAAKEPDALAELASWIARHIDAHADDYGRGKPYAYLAARLLYEIPENLIGQNYPVLPQALLQIRKHKLMIGYSFTNDEGKTIYRLPLDL